MKNQELYEQFYSEISKRQLSNSEAFDKAILSLSSAGLALSLTFFKFVVPINQAVSIGNIKWAWYFFLAAIISTIFSFMTSQIALRIQLKFAENYYLKDKKEYESRQNIASNMTEVLNIVSALFFIGALVNVVIFVVKNI